MPNNVTNQLIIKSSRKGAVKSFYDSLKRKGEDGKEERFFDFSCYVPMPESLHISESSAGDKALKFLKELAGKEYTEEDLKEAGISEEDIELGRKYMQNIKSYGYKSWYGWSLEHWGTKWNSYDNIIEYDRSLDTLYIQFDSAWSAPIPVIKEFVRRNPDLTGTYVYADEDSGFNTGRGNFTDGSIFLDSPENESGEAWDCFFETHPQYRNDFIYTDSGWRYDDDEYRKEGEKPEEVPLMDSDSNCAILQKARALLSRELTEVRNESFRNLDDKYRYKKKFQDTLNELNEMRLKLGLPVLKETEEEEEQ